VRGVINSPQFSIDLKVLVCIFDECRGLKGDTWLIK